MILEAADSLAVGSAAAVGYGAIVAFAVAAHFAFLLYLLAGGFIAARRPVAIWPHVAAVAWALAITASVVECPLTALERWARGQAGMTPLPEDGFIAHYLTGVFYPHGWSETARAAAFAVVAVSWTIVWWKHHRRTAIRR